MVRRGRTIVSADWPGGFRQDCISILYIIMEVCGLHVLDHVGLSGAALLEHECYV